MMFMPNDLLESRIRKYIDRDVSLDNQVCCYWNSSSEYSPITNYISYRFKLEICEYIITKIPKFGYYTVDYYNFKTVNSNNVFDINQTILEELYNCVHRLSEETTNFRICLNKLKTDAKISTQELNERLDEFDVIRNNKIDKISLNSLFDFYEIETGQCIDDILNEIDFL